MKISTKGRYGCRAMLDLANRYGHGPIMVKDIAARQELSEKYLEQILSELRKAGLVNSVQGKNGGFQLAKKPDQITLFDVINALEGGLAPVRCVEDATYCDRISHCVMKDVWAKLMEHNASFFRSLSLKNLIEMEEHKLGKVGGLNFSI